MSKNDEGLEVVCPRCHHPLRWTKYMFNVLWVIITIVHFLGHTG